MLERITACVDHGRDLLMTVLTLANAGISVFMLASRLEMRTCGEGGGGGGGGLLMLAAAFGRD